MDAQKKFSVHDDHSKEELARALIGAAQMCRFLIKAFHVMEEIAIDRNIENVDLDADFAERMNEAQHQT